MSEHFDFCIQAPEDPTIYKVKGQYKIGYPGWEDYVADGKPEVVPVTVAQRDQYQTVAHFPDGFAHVQPACELGRVTAGLTQYDDRLALLEAAIPQCEGALYLEFGCLTGATLNVIARLLPDETIYGFDSFEGLPEDWGPSFRKGHFATDKRPRLVENARLVEGWFDRTLKPFLKEHSGKVAFAHIDSDVYGSAKYVLDTLAWHRRLHKGTVIQFDEIFAEKNGLWYTSEYDALTEFDAARRLEYEWIGWAGESAALRIKSISSKGKTK